MQEIKTDIEEQLLDWYWQYGSQRGGRWLLDRGGWLDRALKIVNEATAVINAKTPGQKRTMALWGPSASGKSTLLAQFIDADGVGCGSALCWDASAPARFSGRDPEGKAIVLNPYNNGDDASGCVTRFQLRDTVEYPQYPVEIRFSSHQDILLYLAVGYMGETTAKDQNDDEVFWDAEKLRGLVKDFCDNHGSGTATPDKEAYKLLRDVCNVVDVLVDMKGPRYSNLRKEWPKRRAEILNEAALACNYDNVVKFAAKLLWDGWDSLTDVFRKLCEKRRKLNAKRYFCSMEMAALMLNISSTRLYYCDGDVREQVRDCRLKELGNGDVALVVRDTDGTRFFSDTNTERDFALTQGLVSLMIVPLKKSVIRKTCNEVANLLEEADLVDFPGVANRDPSVVRTKVKGEDLALDAAPRKGEMPLPALTCVLKRGKTASIVISYSRNLNIDAFSLLVRMTVDGTSVVNTDQIVNGVRSWFKSMGRQSDPLDTSGELPINLVLTFAAQLINTVLLNGSTGKGGLTTVFDKLRDLGKELVNPKIVKTFCVTYPKFNGGDIRNEFKGRVQEAISMILEDQSFKEQFEGTEASLREMAAPEEEKRFGGRLYLFENMLKQLQNSRLQKLLDEKLDRLKQEWRELMDQALPPAGEDADTRIPDLEKLIQAVTGPEQASPERSRKLSQHILDFEDLEMANLDPLPEEYDQVHDYVARQINNWQAASMKKELQTELGFESAEHRARVLDYLRGNIEAKQLIEWLKQLAGADRLTAAERSECRRLVAAFLGNQLFPVRIPHRPEAECVRKLDSMANGENTYDPYKESVVDPFVSVLESLKNSTDPQQRGNQPGDGKLAEIDAELKNAFAG